MQFRTCASFAASPANFISQNDTRGNRDSRSGNRGQYCPRDSLLHTSIHGRATLARFGRDECHDRSVGNGVTRAITHGIGFHDQSFFFLVRLEAQVTGLGGCLLNHTSNGVIADFHYELAGSGFFPRSGLQIGNAVLRHGTFYFGSGAWDGEFEYHRRWRYDQVFVLVKDERSARDDFGLSDGHARRASEEVNLLRRSRCDVEFFTHISVAAFDRDLVVARVAKLVPLKLNLFAELYLLLDRGSGTDNVERCVAAS